MAMMGLGLIIPLLLIGGLAYALGWRPPFNKANPNPPHQTPVDILNSRYARGEITRAENDRIRQDLAV